MSVIQNIREKYAKLAGGLIALSLIAFIITSASESSIGTSLKELFGMEKGYVLKVNGEKVEPQEYTRRMNAYETLYELYAPDRKMNDVTRAQLRDQVVNELVFEKLVARQLDKLGLTESKDEETQLIKGNDPDDLVKRFPYFLDPKTQQFDPQALFAFENKKLGDMSDPRVQKALEQWGIVKEYVVRNHRLQRFSAMVVSGVYQPKFVIDRQLRDQSNLADIQYVKVPFTAINDNDPAVKTTDADLKDYISRHSAQFTINDPVRTIEYVSFEEMPSSQDTLKVLDAMQRLRNDFAASTNDEAFVGRNSSEPYSGAYVTKKTFMSALSDSIMRQPVGTVIGPYYENDAYRLVKIEDRRTLPDSVKCRHILVRTEEQGQARRSDTAAKALIDSIENAIRGGADFAAMAAKYSEDPGSKDKGGEYEFSLAQRGGLSKEFADFIFEGKTGEKKVVKVSNQAYAGYHYIEILSQKNEEPAVKLAMVTKPLLLSPETDQTVFNRATQFAASNNTATAFDQAATKGGLTKRTAANVRVSDFTIEGMGASREVINWAYEAKVGEVSPQFKLDGRYVVAKLVSSQEQGLQQIDDRNRAQIESYVKAEKKAKLITEKYKGATSLEAVSQQAGQPIAKADSFNASNVFIPNVGPAPAVVGYAFYEGFKPNTLSPAIKSGDGVFYIRVTGRRQGAVPATAELMGRQQAMQMEMQMKNNMANSLILLLRRTADIRYNPKMM